MVNVLIPTDFSNSAMHAIHHAVNLLKCERTNFYLLHAYSDELYASDVEKKEGSFEKLTENIHKKTKKMLQDAIREIMDLEGNPKHKFQALSANDHLVDAVNDYVKQINIDLVIMGTQGKTADKNITFGSHTVQVFKYVQCPVLAIPGNFDYEPPIKILFPTDYMIPYKRRELKLLNTFAAEFKSEVHCLYISDFEVLSHRQLDNKRFLMESLPDAYLSFELTSVRNKAEAILDYISKNDIKMLVMVNSRHSFLEDMLYRSTVDEIGLHLKLPFLVMQNLPR